jgi:predicted HTH domain antitoxin
MLVDAGLYGNMSELIREAVRTYIGQQKITNVDLAVELYKKEKISLGKAAAIAGLSYDEMLDTLYLRGVQPKFEPASKKEAEKELETAGRLLK